MKTQLGEQFARTLAARDADALRALLSPTMSFRALTPGSTWKSGDAQAVVNDVILGAWFPSECRITRILALGTGEVGPIEWVSYRFAVEREDGHYVIEQQAYYKTQNGMISWLHILCSGFVQ
jgi:hypothetical protein